jgi:pyrimidine-specific ribonucleoside hydrolase
MIPVIDLTDLYHPFQDPGDNFDVNTAFALPEIDLWAVILDITQEFLEPSAKTSLGIMREGPRSPGLIPVTQLNAIFDRNVPHGLGLFTRLCSRLDAKWDAPAFQQSGVQLILETLRQSQEPVEVAVFCSSRLEDFLGEIEPVMTRIQSVRTKLKTLSLDRVFFWLGR